MEQVAGIKLPWYICYATFLETHLKTWHRGFNLLILNIFIKELKEFDFD